MVSTNTFHAAAFDDDDDEGGAGCALFIAFVLALVISGYFTLSEARYWVFGKTAIASIVHVQPPIASDYSDGVFAIRYSFIDSSTKKPREESDSVPAAWGPPPRELDVQYLPGRPSDSRIAGHRSLFAVWIFAITCLCGVGGVAYLYIDAKRALSPHQAGGKSTRRRRGRRFFPNLGRPARP